MDLTVGNPEANHYIFTEEIHVNGKIVAGCVVFLVCVCVGIHFYAQWDLARFNASLPSPPTQQETAVDLYHAPTGDNELETVPSVVEPMQPLVPDTSQPPVFDTWGEPMPEGETSAQSDDIPKVETPEELYYGDYTMEELIDIRDWAKDLDAKLQENYSELTELAGMTPEEIAERYPTEEDKQYLAELGQEMLDFYAEELGALLTVIPAEIRESILSDLRNQLVQNWGQDAAARIMARFDDSLR